MERFPLHSARPGFRLVIAETSSAVVGFAYGYTGGPGQPFTDTVGSNLSEEERQRWLNGQFELVELAVDPAFQGKGVGGALHDALLGGRPEPTALLATQDLNLRALELYGRKGWTALRRGFRFSGSPVGWSVMVRDLSGTPVT